MIPLRQRPKYSGYVQITWALGTITGPLIGGAFSQHSTWRWIFYLNFPFCGIGLLMIPLVVRIEKPKSTLSKMFSRVDWFGGLLFVGGTTSFLVAITWAGSQFPWDSYRTLVPLIIGTAGCVATIIWEKWGAKFPFVRMSIFESGSMFAAYYCAAMQGLLLYAEIYYISFYLQAVKSLSPTRNGVVLLPMSCATIPGSVLTGILMTKFGRFRWAVWTGWAIISLATGLLCLLDTQTKPVAYLWILFVLGIGHGMLLSSLNYTIQAISSSQDVAYAAALYAFVRGVGLCLGVAIGGTVFQNLLARYLSDKGLPKSISNDAEEFVSTLITLPNSAYRDDLLGSYTKAFQVLFAILTGLSAVAGIVSSTIKTHSIDKVLDSEHVVVLRSPTANVIDEEVKDNGLGAGEFQTHDK